MWFPKQNISYRMPKDKLKEEIMARERCIGKNPKKT